MSTDPTQSGPVVDTTAEPVGPTPEPTPTVGADQATYANPAGTAAPPLGIQALAPYSDRPEILVGIAFTGGLLAAQILKRLGG